VGGIVGIVLISVGGLALIAGAIRLMVWSDRRNRQRVERRLETWKADGSVGPPPSDYLGSGSTGIN
jgi:hypothetical protein